MNWFNNWFGNSTIIVETSTTLDRQDHFFTDTCDYYKYVDLMNNLMPGNNLDTMAYSSTPTYSGVKYYHHSSPEIGTGRSYGRVNIENTPSITDAGHFKLDINLRPGDVIQNKNVLSPFYDVWFLIVGDVMVRPRFGRKQVVYLKRILRPRFV